ncbi:MAG: reverse transcriptase domain-containing protein [bacterium]
MDSILKHLPFVFCYLDDIIIASHSLEEHIEHLRQIFTILQENGLQINPAKCVFAAAAVEFLGTGWTRTACGRSRGTCRPSVIFPPLRM